MRISDWSSDVCSSDLAVDRGVADIRIERRHDVERLHDVGAILARQREEGFEGDFAFERAYRVEQFGVFLRRMAADVEPREAQRGEFMPHRQDGQSVV